MAKIRYLIQLVRSTVLHGKQAVFRSRNAWRMKLQIADDIPAEDTAPALLLLKSPAAATSGQGFPLKVFMRKGKHNSGVGGGSVEGIYLRSHRSTPTPTNADTGNDYLIGEVLDHGVVRLRPAVLRLALKERQALGVPTTRGVAGSLGRLQQQADVTLSREQVLDFARRLEGATEAWDFRIAG